MFKALLLIFTLTISGSAFASGASANDVSKETTSIEIPETEVQSEKLSKGEGRGRCKAKSGDGSSSCRKRFAKKESGPIPERVKLRLPVGVRKNEFSLSMIMHNSLILMREKLDRMF